MKISRMTFQSCSQTLDCYKACGNEGLLWRVKNYGQNYLTEIEKYQWFIVQKPSEDFVYNQFESLNFEFLFIVISFSKWI